MKTLRRSTIFLTVMFVVLLGILGMMAATGDHGQKILPSEPLVIINAKGERCLLIVKLAVSSKEQEKGLMFLRTLAPDAGMLFVLATPRSSISG